MPENLTKTWDFYVRQRPSRLWSFVANTALLHEFLGFSRYNIDVTGRDSQGLFLGVSKCACDGVFSREIWFEKPCEWVEGRWWRCHREYRKGCLASIETTLILDKALNGTVVRCTIVIKPRSEASSFFVRRLSSFAKKKEDFRLFLEQADSILLNMSNGAGGENLLGDVVTSSRRHVNIINLQIGCEALRQSEYANGVVQFLEHALEKAMDTEVELIRSRHLAHITGKPEREVTETCLAAVHAGVLRIRYLLCCPRCRRVCFESQTLGDLPVSGECVYCVFEFETDLAWNVEVVFLPSDTIRTFPSGTHCSSGPMTMQHVLLQQIVQPEERRSINFTFQPGRYRIRSGRTQTNDVFFTYHGDKGFPVITIHPGGYISTGDECIANMFIIENQDIEQHLVVLDRNEWRNDALTAAELCVLQSFQDLRKHDAPMSKDGLRAGRPTLVAVSIASPEMVYTRYGHEEGLYRINKALDSLKRVTRNTNGGIFRSNGAAVVVAFRQPLDAVLFSSEAQKIGVSIFSGDAPEDVDDDFIRFTRSNSDSVPVEGARIGITMGLVLATCRFNKFDFDGQAVAIAERLCSLANPGEILAPVDLVNELDVLDASYVGRLKPEVVNLSEGQELNFYRIS
jgi:class 3 adenylate cyclase